MYNDDSLENLFHRFISKKSKKYKLIQKQLESSNDKQNITPSNILLGLIDIFFGLPKNNKVEVQKFEKELVKQLSLLTTNGQSEDIYGKNFNDLMLLFVRALNLAGKMKQVLEENGIEFKLDEED